MITYHNERVETTRTPSTTNPYNLISTLLFPLASRQCQLHPRRRVIVVHAPEILEASVDCEGEVRHVSEGVDGNFGQYPEGGTASVVCKGNPTNS